MLTIKKTRALHAATPDIWETGSVCNDLGKNCAVAQKRSTRPGRYCTSPFIKPRTRGAIGAVVDSSMRQYSSQQKYLPVKQRTSPKDQACIYELSCRFWRFYLLSSACYLTS